MEAQACSLVVGIAQMQAGLAELAELADFSLESRSEQSFLACIEAKRLGKSKKL